MLLLLVKVELSCACISVIDMMDYQFDRKDLVCLGLCGVFGVWYLLKKVYM